MGLARAEGYRKQTEALGQGPTAAVAVASAVADGHLTVVPEVAAAHGGLREAIGEAIRRHVVRNPGAKDSARGVAEWCRAEIGFVPREDLTKEVLAELERQGHVASSVLVDGTRVYHAPPP